VCRYAIPYKPHYACFACRKAFKRRLLGDIRDGGPHRSYVCPQCAGPMADMGLDFAPPPMQDRKAWQVLEWLYEVGETFHSCGCQGPGYRPRDPAALRGFLEQRSAQFEANARRAAPGPWRPPADGERLDGEEARAWWAERASRVRAAMANL
jgi:hypothetical protein